MITAHDTLFRRTALIATACLVAVAGCRADHSTAEAEGEEEHHGHVIPAHRTEKLS